MSDTDIIVRVEPSSPGDLHAEQDGRRVSLERAFKEGFRIDPEDAPAVLSLIDNHVRARDSFQK